ncbi:carbohydrate sulfotransferase 15-like [Physella acuta]|uniref:carbohydrate sulfotransferase 15-like n=1 Tax=Physella acuta TaxID=109671 RepID=UPI0027DD126C|nr:carbohydrate sulfotransferase 15-like [Physella acuta]XP_059177869.1 carbohydrate sulfotransferase 15-like [Physella acuta]
MLWTEVTSRCGFVKLLTSSVGTRTMRTWVLLLSGAVLVLVCTQLSWSNVSRMSIQSATVYDTAEPSCIDRLAPKYNRVEDIFCLNLPKFLPQFKNPCFYEYFLMGKRKLRCLPYFYIIGMDKSGSTDLHGRIAKHPLIYGNAGEMDKETQFWSWSRYGFMNKRRGLMKTTLDNYMDLFSQTAQVIDAHNDTEIITGDATPMDLWDFRGWPMIPQNSDLNEPWVLTPHFLKYIYKGAPKLIIQFREPIDRLYSDYVFLDYGKDPLEFHKHSLQAIDMMNACLKNHSTRFCYFDYNMYQKLPARIHLGCYSVFLKEWFRVFPRSAFHVTRTTEYKNDMEGTLKGVFDFLEIPQLSKTLMADVLNQTKRHVTAEKKGVALPETVKVLREFYADCNKETAELLGDDRFLWKDHYS